MATLEYELFAAVGKYQDQNGKDRTKTRKVGAVWRHTNGDPYVEIDPFFNFAAGERKPGSDRLFLKMTPPQGGQK